MTIEPSVRQLGILVAAASLVLGACSPSASGGSGRVQQEPIETVSTDFPFTATGPFTVGDAPANAAFDGGIAVDGAWVVRAGDTGTVVFTTPTRDLSFETTVAGVTNFSKPTMRRVIRKTTCGLSDQGNDNSEAYGQEMFMRGGFNDWGNPTPSDEFIFYNFGGGVYQSEFEMVAGEYNYKVADAGWSVERATDPGDTLEVNDTQPLLDPGPGGPEGVLNVPADGCYNFTLNVTDADNATITMTEVDLSGGGGGTPPRTCGLSDQGNDNSEAYGQEMFMRGGFNDWGNPTPSDEFLFINFGGGEYRAEFEMVAGEFNYKVADAGWSIERATDPGDILEVGDTQPLLDPGPGGPEGVLNVPADGCYTFTLQVTDPDNATIAMAEADLGGGGTPPRTCGLSDQGNDNSEAYGQEMFMRGGFNDWGNPTPSDEFLFINFGGGEYRAEFEMVAGEYNYKVADAGWSIERATDPGDILEVGDTQPLLDPGPGGPEGVLNVPADGCYTFTLQVTDPDNATIAMAEADLGGGGPPGGGKETCGLEDQGNDNSEAYGQEVFMRGGFNDWGNPSPTDEFLFINFGGGNYQSEFEMVAGESNYKVADAGWTVERATDPGDTLEVNDTQPLLDPGPGGPEGVLNVPSDGCYNFALQVTDADNATITMTEVQIGGGPPPVAGTTDFVATNSDGSSEEVSVEGTGTSTVSFSRAGRDSPIKTLTIEAGNGDVSITNFAWSANPIDAPPAGDVAVVYRNASGDYSDTQIIVGGESFACTPNTTDAFGCTATVNTTLGSVIAFTVENGGQADPTGTFSAFTGDGGESIYAISGAPNATTGTVTGLPQANEAIVYYIREDETFDGWNLHLFPQDPATGDWTIFNGAEECVVEGTDDLGTYFRITLPPNPCYDANPDPLDEFPIQLGFVIHQGDAKAPDGDVVLRIGEDGNVVWVDEGNPQVLSAPPSDSAVSITGRAAHWVDAETVLWDHGADVTSVELLWSEDASIEVLGSTLGGNFESAALTETDNPQPPNQLHLGGFPAYALPDDLADSATDIARSQIVAVGLNELGLAVEATFVQIPGALDDLYAAAAVDAELGVTWDGTAPTVRVWAPTARVETGVTLNVYSDPDTLDETVDMTLDEASGVWTAEGDASWDRKYYDFTLDVYSYAVDQIVTNTVTDPYSASLSSNSRRSQFVNLDDQDLKPAGWDDLTLPAFGEPEDIVVYEQQMRDFSASDFTVPEALRGKYQAFTLDNTDGHAHLQALSDAGLTHMHLLPSFDIATIEEERANRVELDDPVDDLCAANSDAAGLCPEFSGMSIRELLEMKTAEDPTDTFQQQVVTWLRNLDGYNWGYDPWHYGVPEGSYASDPEGVARIIEYREMVQGLADKGLRLVIDVVYNHTNQGGQGDKSVLDRMVPGYYHRYNETSGAIETSTCCSNTASEFAMMGKLMDDTMIQFLEDYKITGFRYDLMGFHTKDQMVALLATLRDIDPTVYIYGEGWNFGEVADDRRFVQATQLNLAGTGIGTFTDRIRDAVRGGGPFDSGAARTVNQGFINGGGYDPNAENVIDDPNFIEEALCTSDQIRATMAGSIQTFPFEDRTGTVITGAELGYSSCTSDTPTSYVDDPEEIINYSASHDNETIFDISQYKHPAAVSAADRTRAENIGMDAIILAQGVPFLHSGQDLLRSKSVDRDSFDFGDWFNQQDFSRMSNNWAVGLPNAEKNEAEWPDITELFENPNSIVTPDDINFAHEHAKEMLQIRASTVLYRLRTGAQIVDRVEYFNTGPEQTPGLIVQGIDGCVGDGLDPEYGYVVNILNANDEDQTIELFTDETFELHPVLQSSVDTVVQSATHDASGFFVPARTTAVFVKTQDGTDCEGGGGGPAPGAGFDDAVTFIRGGFNDWGITDPMVEVADSGIYEVTVDVLTGGFDYKAASEDWATVNCGAPTDGSLTVELDTTTVVECSETSGNVSSTFPADDDYQFTVDSNPTGAETLTVTAQTGDDFDLAQVFIRGGFNGWSEDNPMTAVGTGGHEATITIAAGASDFKVASSDWATVNCGGALGQVPPVAGGTDYYLSCSATSGNMSSNFGDGDYKFSVSENPESTGNPQLFFEELSAADYGSGAFVRGGFNGWSIDNPMTNTGGTIYEAVVPVTAGSAEFKIASEDWAALNCGQTHFGDIPTLAPGDTTAISCDDNSGNLTLDVPADGNLTFTLDAAVPGTPTLTISGP